MTNWGEQAAIEVDWRPVWWSLVWSWILIFIPTAVLAAKNAGVSFTVGDGALTARKGVSSKRTEHLELYRVRSVSTSGSPFSGGRVSIEMQDGSIHVIKPIKNPDDVGSRIRAEVNKARGEHNIQTRENL